MKRPDAVEVEAYARSIGFEKLSGEYFVDYWETRGWLVKPGIPMKSWQAAVRNWKRLDWGTSGKKAEDGRAEFARRQAEKEQWDREMKDYRRKIEACRSWRDDRANAPMGDPDEEERRLWMKAERNFGRRFVGELRGLVGRCQ